MESSYLSQAAETAKLAGNMKRMANARRAAGLAWDASDLPAAGVEQPNPTVSSKIFRAKVCSNGSFCRKGFGPEM
eukprot:1158942-Pelagomonas_calceolata.AAC.9